MPKISRPNAPPGPRVDSRFRGSSVRMLHLMRLHVATSPAARDKRGYRWKTFQALALARCREPALSGRCGGPPVARGIASGRSQRRNCSARGAPGHRAARGQPLPADQTRHADRRRAARVRSTGRRNCHAAAVGRGNSEPAHQAAARRLASATLIQQMMPALIGRR
jgi:hypothetical protein